MLRDNLKTVSSPYGLFQFNAVQVNWKHPHDTPLRSNGTEKYGDRMLSAKIACGSDGVAVTLFHRPFLLVTDIAHFENVNEFTEYWDIVDRRVLIEKTGHCL